ncbi:MAG: 4Fe-4S binding protein [Planctomycetes bacterium]|nr:4Fe-4S binding protein [Planctomycetota bacterium]
MTEENQSDLEAPDPLPVAGPAAERDLAASCPLAPADSREGFNLLRLRAIRALILWSGFPYIFQVLMLAVFVGLAVLSWGVFASQGVSAKLFAKTHLATLLTWGVWWPAMVWMAVFLGRAWCMLCPLELVSNSSERLGRRLGLPQRPVRKWMVTGTIILALYAMIQFLVAGAHINRTLEPGRDFSSGHDGGGVWSRDSRLDVPMRSDDETSTGAIGRMRQREKDVIECRQISRRSVFSMHRCVPESRFFLLVARRLSDRGASP